VVGEASSPPVTKLEEGSFVVGEASSPPVTKLEEGSFVVGEASSPPVTKLEEGSFVVVTGCPSVIKLETLVAKEFGDLVLSSPKNNCPKDC